MKRSAPASFVQPPSAWRQPMPWLSLVGVPLLAWVFFGPAGMPVEVKAKTWRHDVAVERRVREMDSDWCERMPADAELVERQLREDPSGRRGLAPYCRFMAWNWRTRRLAVLEGSAPTPPRWPQPVLEAPGTPDGERLGKRTAVYELVLTDEEGREWPCRPPLAVWQALQPGQRTRLVVDKHKVADCSTLPLPRSAG